MACSENITLKVQGKKKERLKHLSDFSENSVTLTSSSSYITYPKLSIPEHIPKRDHTRDKPYPRLELQPMDNMVQQPYLSESGAPAKEYDGLQC